MAPGGCTDTPNLFTIAKGHMNEITYGITSFILGLMLFFPVRTFIMTMMINKQRAKTKEEPSAEEIEELKKRISWRVAIIAFTFSFIFNKFLILKLYGGG